MVSPVFSLVCLVFSFVTTNIIFFLQISYKFILDWDEDRNPVHILLSKWFCHTCFDILHLIFYSLSEHKYEIVKRLQARKHICGMTGDGVNDAPALKKADIGIAVADATDAARSASDIVLTEPGLSVIISAVLTSRAIFQRMKNYTVRLSEKLSWIRVVAALHFFFVVIAVSFGGSVAVPLLSLYI